MSYSLKIGPSTYYVSSRMKNLNNNSYFLVKDVSSRSKSVNDSMTSSLRSQRSRSLKRSVSPESRPTTRRYGRIINDINLSAKQQQQISNQIYHRRYTQSKFKTPIQVSDRIMTTDKKILVDKVHQKTVKEEKSSSKSIKKKRKPSTETIIGRQKQEIIQLFNEQKQSLTLLLEEHIRTMATSSINVIKQIVTEALHAQEQTSTEKLEHTLIQTIHQELQQITPKNIDKTQINSVDVNTLNRLEDILTRTIEKYITTSNENDNTALNHLFTEQKQVLVEALTQQRSTPSIDIIKQAVIDALSEQNSQSITSNTKTNITNRCETTTKITNNEIQIIVNLNQTRIDTAFRQERDTIVANRYLRDTVRQLSHVRSMSSLVKKIQVCSTNDFENAWLLFCWIGQNISYDFDCENHSAESVFQNRTGSCEGFVNVFYECCSLLNIQCTKISGYTKETFLRKVQDLKKFSHSWNSIVLDNYTYLVDSAWGAGANNNNGNQFQDYYFLTSADEFIYTHYSNDYQLLQPAITKQEFLSLPVMKSNYYRLNLSLLTPKQGFNQTNENIIKISLKTPAYVDLFASLISDNIEYPCHLHTFCQRDINQTDTMNCFFAPPNNGLYEIKIFSKTNNEKKYEDTIYMRLKVSNMIPAITFPIIYQSFIEYKCILVEPFRRHIQENEDLVIHMKIPDAIIIKIKNGADYIIPNKDEYKNGLLRKKVHIQGDLHVCAQWNDKTNQPISTICIFTVT